MIARPVLYLGAAVAAVALLYVLRKGGAAAAGEGAGRAVVDAAGGAVSGVVKGIGATVGIPDTSADTCARALAEGRTWDASFACPAPTFIGALWDKATGQAPPPVDETILDRWDYAARGGSSNSGNLSDRSFDDLARPDMWLLPDPTLGYSP